jgi:hypothetical protein
MLVQDGSGSRVPSWTTAVNWPGGTAPVFSGATGAVDLVTLAKINSEWWGVYNLNFSEPA